MKVPILKKWGITLLFLLLITAGCARLASPDKKPNSSEIIVAAAADLMPAFEEIGRVFTEQNGTKVIFNFGSTGQLAQQIEQGAPVDIFAAANVSYIEELEKRGLILPETKALYAQGRITLWMRDDNARRVERIEDLARPDIKRIAIANPEHAPYGVAAREALQSARIWDTVQPKLVFGENVRQTLQYAESGNVDVAIVALSLSVQSNGHWTLVPQNMHQPLNQTLAVIKSTRHEEDARRFAAFINNTQGRAVMRKYGFILPGEEVAR